MNRTQILAEADRLLEKIKSNRPLSELELRELQKSLKVAFTYNSNAIEGNTLTLGETKLLLEEGLTVGGKSVREMNEALNHNALFELLFAAVRDQTPLSERLIRDAHALVLHNIDDGSAGSYRKIQAYISGDERKLPGPKQLPKLMRELVAWTQAQKQILHPVVWAGEFHQRFVNIHPFIDGNGRTVRILINILLMQLGYPLIIIPRVRRGEYISTLNSASPPERFIDFFADIVLQNLKDYFFMIAPAK